ncbi:MAG: hypothetical protein M3539_05490, partial [Acidobacteriota bacterium]|nr:hypothetical protein [Acidobacteriota bacterium]
ERTITGTARVQNNRTMMLASVAQDVQSNGRQGLPILGLIPVLGRLFTSPTRDNRRIDIVIAVTPRVLRAPAVTPRDEEMRPSGTLQSPTTGSLEAMLRDADREDQLAAARIKQPKTTANASLPGMFPTAPPAVSQSAQASTQPNAAPPAVNTAPTNVVTGNAVTNNAVANQVGQPTTTTTQQPAPADELPAFVPAPKSLISNSAASEVAAVNTNLNNGAVLTSLPKPIETAVTPVSSRSRIAQISLSAPDQAMKAGETRRVAVELKSDVSLAMAVVALRFDPKVLKVRGISAGTPLAQELLNNGKDGKPFATFMQSVDPNGVCLISISNMNGATSLQGAGTLLFIEVEALADGVAALAFDKSVMHLVATDAREVILDVLPARETPKQ